MAGNVLTELSAIFNIGGNADEELSSFIRELAEAQGGTEGLEQNMSTLQKEMVDSAKSMGISKKELSGIIAQTKEQRHVTEFAKKYGVSMDAVKSKTKSAKEAMQGLQGVVKALAAAGAISALLSFGGGAAKLAADYEQTQVAFNVMIKDAEKTKQVIADLDKFSNVTPFEPEQVNEAAKTLMQFKVSTEDLIPLMTKVGDVAAGTGKSYNDLAAMVGKAHALNKLDNEMLQSVPVLYGALAEAMGKTEKEIFEMASKGQLGFAELEAALGSLTDTGGLFAGSMKNQSETALGLLSTMTGNMNMLKRTIGEMILQAAKPLLKVVIDITSWMMQNKAAMAIFKSAILILVPVIGVILVAALWSAASAAWGMAAGILAAAWPFMVAAAAITAVILVIQDLYTWLNGGESVIGHFLGPFTQIGSQIKAIFTGILQTVVSFFSAVKQRTIAFYTGVIQSVTAFFVTVKNAIGAAINTVISFLKEKGKYIIMAMFPLTVLWFYRDQIFGFFKMLPDRIVAFFTAMPEKLTGILKGLKEKAADILKGILPDWALKFVGQFSGEKVKAYANGGDVEAGQPCIVGDGGGPELFIPKTPGTIIPNGGSSRGKNIQRGEGSQSPSFSFALTVNMNGGSKDDADSIAQRIKEEIEKFFDDKTTQMRTQLGLA